MVSECNKLKLVIHQSGILHYDHSHRISTTVAAVGWGVLVYSGHYRSKVFKDGTVVNLCQVMHMASED